MSSNTIHQLAVNVDASLVSAGAAMKNAPRETLARNLTYLMDKHGHTNEYVGKRAGIASKTVNNMARNRTSVTLDKVQAVAEVYGLDAWHLIMPNLPSDLVETSVGERLISAYVSADKEGRELLDMVAERESRKAN